MDRRDMHDEALEAELTLPRFLKDRRFWLAVLALGVIVAIHASGLPGSLTLETLRTTRDIVTFVSENYVLSALGYIAIYALVVALSLPSAVLLTLSGGFLFGAVTGTMFTLIGATIGATLLFIFARTLMGDNAMSHFGTTGAKPPALSRQMRGLIYLCSGCCRCFPSSSSMSFRLWRRQGQHFCDHDVLRHYPRHDRLLQEQLGDVLDQGNSITIDLILTPEITFS